MDARTYSVLLFVACLQGHCLKNELAEVSDVARKLHAYNMVLLTGTPLQVGPQSPVDT
jgi:SNF2 family DNA or RNA helicase